MEKKKYYLIDANGEEHEILSVNITAAEAQAKRKFNGFQTLNLFPLPDDYLYERGGLHRIVHVRQEENLWKIEDGEKMTLRQLMGKYSTYSKDEDYSLFTKGQEVFAKEWSFETRAYILTGPHVIACMKGKKAVLKKADGSYEMTYSSQLCASRDKKPVMVYLVSYDGTRIEKEKHFSCVTNGSFTINNEKKFMENHYVTDERNYCKFREGGASYFISTSEELADEYVKNLLQEYKVQEQKKEAEAMKEAERKIANLRKRLEQREKEASQAWNLLY